MERTRPSFAGVGGGQLQGNTGKVEGNEQFDKFEGIFEAFRTAADKEEL